MELDPALALLRSSRGIVPAKIAVDLGGALDLDTDGLMVELVGVAKEWAVAPVSGYRVGAVALGVSDDGKASLYFGANMEFVGGALPLTIHAEQAAVMNAWLHGERGIAALAVSAPPCGHCRQFLHELGTTDQLRVLTPSAGKDAYASRRLSYYLPEAFGPLHLPEVRCRDGSTPALMRRACRADALEIEGESSDPAVIAALGAARASYAPYSGRYSGCAVETDDGSIFVGRVAENAAYNPTILALPAALSFLEMNTPAGASVSLTRAVLVEVPGPVGQRRSTEAVLEGVAPGISLEYHSVRAI